MIYCTYHDWQSSPLTDEDLSIMRRMAERIGGQYYGIHQTISADSHRRDVFNTRQWAKTTKGIYSLRRDSCDRLVMPASCMA